MNINKFIYGAKPMNAEMRKKFRQLLEEWMAENELSQREAGKRLGCSQSAIRSWLQEYCSPSWEGFELFAKQLGKEPEFLYAELRGSGFQAPALLPYQDVERLVMELSPQERAALAQKLVASMAVSMA